MVTLLSRPTEGMAKRSTQKFSHEFKQQFSHANHNASISRVACLFWHIHGSGAPGSREGLRNDVPTILSCWYCCFLGMPPQEQRIQTLPCFIPQLVSPGAVRHFKQPDLVELKKSSNSPSLLLLKNNFLQNQQVNTDQRWWNSPYPGWCRPPTASTGTQLHHSGAAERLFASRSRHKAFVDAGFHQGLDAWRMRLLPGSH